MRQATITGIAYQSFPDEKPYTLTLPVSFSNYELLKELEHTFTDYIIPTKKGSSQLELDNDAWSLYH